MNFYVSVFENAKAGTVSRYGDAGRSLELLAELVRSAVPRRRSAVAWRRASPTRLGSPIGKAAWKPPRIISTG